MSSSVETTVSVTRIEGEIARLEINSLSPHPTLKTERSPNYSVSAKEFIHTIGFVVAEDRTHRLDVIIYVRSNTRIADIGPLLKSIRHYEPDVEIRCPREIFQRSSELWKSLLGTNLHSLSLLDTAPSSSPSRVKLHSSASRALISLPGLKEFDVDFFVENPSVLYKWLRERAKSEDPFLDALQLRVWVGDTNTNLLVQAMPSVFGCASKGDLELHVAGVTDSLIYYAFIDADVEMGGEMTHTHTFREYDTEGRLLPTYAREKERVHADNADVFRARKAYTRLVTVAFNKLDMIPNHLAVVGNLLSDRLDPRVVVTMMPPTG